MASAVSNLVVVLDDVTGTALEPASVGLVDEGSTRGLTGDAEGRWTTATAGLAAGVYELRIEFEDRPRLCLRLRATLERGEVAFEFVGGQPRCCALERDDTRDDEQRTRLTVTLAPRHEELIFVAGWDYSGKTPTTRAGARPGATTSTPARPCSTLGPASASSSSRPTKAGTSSTGACKAASHLRSRPTKIPAPPTSATPTTRSRSPTSASLAAEAAKPKRSCIFSHAWAGGPVLANTNETPLYAYSPQRDPGDKDGRTKDFSVRNMPEREQFAAAFAPTAIAKIWGCFATTIYRRMVRAAAKARDPEQPLKVRAGDHTRTISAAQIEAEFRKTIIGNSYMAQPGRAARITVYGAPPGMGANLSAWASATTCS